MTIDDLTQQIKSGVDLTIEQSELAIFEMIDGREADQATAEFLTALADKGESFAELAGAARAIRSRMHRVKTNRERVLDTCGTGGDGSGTFNISTAAAIVTASAGVAVAKHGNRSITSKTGSADVLAKLGVNVEASLDVIQRCLDELGICFCFAPQLHPAVARVAQIRRQLGRPTIFNWIGPLCNPADAPYQLLGVGKPSLRPAMAEALKSLGTTRGAVVCGSDGLDEITLAGETHVSLVDADGVFSMVWHPRDFGYKAASLDSMKVTDVDSSAAMITHVLNGENCPAREIVELNAAAALWIVGEESQLTACVDRVRDAIDGGAARTLLHELSRAQPCCLASQKHYF